MENGRESLHIRTKTYEHTFVYDNTDVLYLDMEWPEVSGGPNPAAAARINGIISMQASGYMAEAAGKLQRQAVQDYKSAQEQGFPFNPHGLTVRYEVTLNGNCTFSFYRDKYIYTGGAHGITPRESDTFDICSGKRITLPSLFPAGTDWRSKVLAQILAAADENLKQDPYLYFDNYRELILTNFNPESFYLTPEAVAVYYQQYDIGPYAIGIPVFEIPYADLGISPPECRC